MKSQCPKTKKKEKSMSCFTIPSIVSKIKIYQLVKPGLEKGANELDFCM